MSIQWKEANMAAMWYVAELQDEVDPYFRKIIKYFHNAKKSYFILYIFYM